MTTIIAIEYDDRVEMISDSQINSNGKPYFHSDMTKIIERNKYLIGVAGRVVALQAILHNWNPPALTATHKGSLYSFVITKLIPSLKSFVDESKIFTEKEKEEGDMFSLLIAIKGEVFEIDDDYSVGRRSDGLYSIGSGAEYALGALLAHADVDTAMQIAESLDVNTHEPFVRLTQYK